MALHLSHRIHGHANRDEQRGAAEIEWHGGIGNQDFGQDANGGEIDGADDRDPRQDVVDVFGRLLAGTYTGQEAAVLRRLSAVSFGLNTTAV